jgi:hypothetical protein
MKPIASAVVAFFLALVGCQAPAPASPWREAYDLDGDGRRDRLLTEYTGGAHCCYRIGAALTTRGETVMLPFELDGGYVGGLDLSQPERFAIRTSPDGLPELLLEIATYNGEQLPLDPEWTRRYRFRTHRVAVCFAGGRVLVRDLAPDLTPCRGGLRGSLPQ